MTTSVLMQVRSTDISLNNLEKALDKMLNSQYRDPNILNITIDSMMVKKDNAKD